MNVKAGLLGLATLLPLAACASSSAGTGTSEPMRVVVENQLTGRYVLQIDGQPVGEIAGSGDTTLEVPRLHLVSRPVRVCVHPVGATRQLICRAEGTIMLPEAVRTLHVYLRSVSTRPQLTVSVSTGG